MASPRNAWGLLPWLFVPLAFIAGRALAPEAVEPAPAGPPEAPLEEAQTPPPSPVVSASATSTAACCPCPPPPRPRLPKPVAIKRKATPPVGIEPAPVEDATGATASYLKESAQQLAACAPATGSGLRVHLEVTVTPAGSIERLRITNLDPLPPEVSACVERQMATLSPPGFDGSRAEVFALTVVL